MTYSGSKKLTGDYSHIQAFLFQRKHILIGMDIKITCFIADMHSHCDVTME